MASFPSQFERSISLNDLDSALHVRELVEQDAVVPEDGKHRFLEATPRYSFVLPSFRRFQVHDFRKFLYNYLVDVEIFKELEATKRLNWCNEVHPMVPLLTIGDGNCLMHAASLAMWAVNDRYQILRRSVYQCFLEDAQGMYHRRWQTEHEQLKQRYLGGYEMTEAQWTHEWEELVNLVSPREFPSGRSGAQFGSLEEIHIFVLANVLRRTIIVLCDDTLRGNYGESFSPVNFCGIYLPLNWDPVDCVKSPLIIGYAQGHFAGIVSFEDGNMDLGNHSFNHDGNSTAIHAVPLVKHDGSPLPIHFLLADEESQANGLLRQYLDCAKVPCRPSSVNQASGSGTVLVAKMNFTPPPASMQKLVEGYFQHARETYQQMLANNQSQSPTVHVPNPSSVKTCRIEGCHFYGSSETADLCSKCLAEYMSSMALQEPVAGSAPNQPHLATPILQPPQCPTKLQQAVAQPAQALHLPVASVPNCRTSSCKYNATVGKGGLCVRCYEAERSAEEMAASVEYHLTPSKPCDNKVNGCAFFGSPQQHNLCSRCYRHFCVKLEDTLGVKSPTSPSAVAQASAPPSNLCHTASCHNPGLPVLYDMCLPCYSACIKAFINSDGKTVGSTVAPPPTVPSLHGTKPAVCKKGILCASPGCFNERIPQLNDLCSQCYQPPKSPPAAVTTASRVSVQTPAFTSAPMPTMLTTTAASSSSGLTPAPLHAAGRTIYCASAECMNLVGNSTGRLCPSCFGQSQGIGTQGVPHNAYVPAILPGPQVPQGQKSPGLPGAASPSLATVSGQYNSFLSQSSSAHQGVPSMPPGSSVPGTRLSECVATSHLGAASSAPSWEALSLLPLKKCATPKCNFFGDPSKNFLCSQCYQKNFAEWQRMGGAAGVVQTAQAQSERSTARQCVMEGCSNIAAPNMNQLCQACFQTAVRQETEWATRQQEMQQGRSQLQVRLNEPKAPSQTSKVAKPFVVAAVPCKTVGCLRFGTQEKNGLCEVCFQQNPLQNEVGQGSHTPTTEAQLGQPAVVPPQHHQPPTRLSSPTLIPVQVSRLQSSLAVQPNSQSNPTAAGPIGHRCRRPMCKMFGASETGGLCSRCFAESTMVVSYPHSVPDAPPSSLISSSEACRSVSPCSQQRECLNAGCSNLADPQMHNHCTECFKELYPELAQRAEYARCFEGSSLQ